MRLLKISDALWKNVYSSVKQYSGHFFLEAEAETRIPLLVFASAMMLKPAFHRWRFKIVRTVGKEEVP
jgi:hypothetical protein